MAEALFFESGDPGKREITCSLCPHRCALAVGRSGLCRVRRNAGGRPDLPFYGRISALNLDPMEKKPLYHFRPGSSVFSAGFVGCNLRCPFCQNWEISQSVDAQTRFLEPRKLVDLAVSGGGGAIAYTYSEPLVHLEYLLEAMGLARAAGLANVLVTNGCVNEEAARRALALCDAANVDLKTFREETYRKTLGGDLGTVRRFIGLAVELGVHTEATTLVVTGMNDAAEEIADCASFLAGLSPDLPYHLSAYHPDYSWDAPATDAAALLRLAGVARKDLNYVYVGNIAGEANDTRCPVCAAVAVERRGYRIDVRGLARGDDGNAYCRSCGAALPFRF